MDDLQLPGSGLFAIALGAAAGLLSALYHLLASLAHFFGWRRSAETKRRDELVRAADDLLAPKLRQIKTDLDHILETKLSEMRQQTSAALKGQDQKLAVIEAELTRYFQQMIDRDERLGESMHQHMNAALAAHEGRVFDRIETMGEHFSELLQTAIDARPAPRRRRRRKPRPAAQPPSRRPLR